MVYKNFTSIVIAGGATKVISVIGVLKFLEENNMINSIINLVGTSAGAVMCAFIALGYKSNEIVDFLKDTLCKDNDVKNINVDDVFKIFETYGFTTGDNVTHLFKRMVTKKLGKEHENITLIELAKLKGKNLVICVSNLTNEQQEFWNVDTKPDVLLHIALKASCAIPLAFAPVKMDGNIYLDGGLYDNFPIDYFKTNKLRDILGINIKCKGYQKTESLVEYVKFILFSVMEKLTSRMIVDNKDTNVISFEFEEDEWLSFLEMKIVFPVEKVDEYVNIGYTCMKERMQSMYIDDFPNE
jgi:predicted acylesterase/phospholipase RssA